MERGSRGPALPELSRTTGSRQSDSREPEKSVNRGLVRLWRDLSYASIARLHKSGTDLDGRRDVHDRLLATEDMDSLTAVLLFAAVMLEEMTRCADDLDNFAGEQNWRDPVSCGTCSISAGRWRRRRSKGGVGGSRPGHRNDTKQSPAPGTRNESVIPLAGGAQMTPVGFFIAIGWRHPSPNPPEEAPAESRSAAQPTRSSPVHQAPLRGGRLASVGNCGC
jgi:hypothetical protein